MGGVVDAEMRIVTEKLQDRFDDRDVREIEAAVEHEAGRFRGARFRSFVPLLVERRAKSRLRKYPDSR